MSDWALGFVRAAVAQLHDVNDHLAWEGNRPTEPPFDWTTNCQHADCRSAREWLAARSSPAPAEGLREEVLRWAFTQYEGVWEREPEVRILGHAGEAAKIIAGVYAKLDREYPAARLSPPVDRDAPPLVAGHTITDEEYREKYSPIIPDRDAPREPDFCPHCGGQFSALAAHIEHAHDPEGER